MDLIENRTFDEIQPGDTASLVRTLQPSPGSSCQGLSSSTYFTASSMPRHGL
jgi:hypothetical protein